MLVEGRTGQNGSGDQIIAFNNEERFRLSATDYVTGNSPWLSQGNGADDGTNGKNTKNRESQYSALCLSPSFLRTNKNNPQSQEIDTDSRLPSTPYWLSPILAVGSLSPTAATTSPKHFH